MFFILAMLQWGGGAGKKRDSFEAEYREYFGRVMAFFRRRGASVEESQDLAQETFLRAWKAREDFRGEAKLSTWIFQIAGNLWINQLRESRAAKRAADVVSISDAPQGALLATGGGGAVGAGGGQASAVAQVLAEEERRLVGQAIARLPEKTRACVEMRVYQDRSYREISDLARTSEQSAKTLVSRAAGQLKAAVLSAHPELARPAPETGPRAEGEESA